MKATLRSVRIAPKKANLVAKMVRGKPVPEAISMLERTNKKAARLLEALVRSAMANATNNEKQNPDEMIVKTLIVNKAQAYQRGIPMARGRQRIIRKFLSHITLQLGYPEEKKGGKNATPKKSVATKAPQTASQETKKTVQKGASATSEKKKVPASKTEESTKKTQPKASSDSKDTSPSSSASTSKK